MAAARSWKKRELYQFVLADTDIRTSIAVADDFIELLRAWKKETLPYHLSEAFVAYVAVSYARPFTHDRRHSSVASLPEKWGKFSDPKLQETHDMMIDLRHTLFAHSDPTSRKLSIIPPGVVLFRQEIAQGTSWELTTFSLPPHSIGELRNTCVDLQRRLQQRITILIDELYGGMDLPRAKFRVRFDEGL